MLLPYHSLELCFFLNSCVAISAAVQAIMCGISLSITRPAPKSNTRGKGNDGVGGFEPMLTIICKLSMELAPHPPHTY